MRSTRPRWGQLLLALIVGLALAGCAGDARPPPPRPRPPHQLGPGARRPGPSADTGFPEEGISEPPKPETTKLKVGETAANVLVAHIEWSPAPEWFAAIGTVGSLLLALRLFARDPDDRRRAQARSIGAWTTPPVPKLQPDGSVRVPTSLWW